MLEQAGSYDWMFFTSANAVEYFLRRLRESGGDIRRFHRARIAAVGIKTGEALLAHALQHEALPGGFQAEGMLEHLAPLIRPGQRALFPRGALARDTLLLDLAGRGVSTDAVTVYETVLPEGQDESAVRLLREGAIQVVTFTSSSTVSNLLEMLGRSGVADAAELLAGCEIACLGPVTARTAREAGLEPTIVPKEATIESLVEAIGARMAEVRLLGSHRQPHRRLDPAGRPAPSVCYPHELPRRLYS